MYVLKGNGGYVKEHNLDGFSITQELDKAYIFSSISRLLQFVSQYVPQHCCGIYNIVSVEEAQRPSYVEDRTIK